MSWLDSILPKSGAPPVGATDEATAAPTRRRIGMTRDAIGGVNVLGSLASAFHDLEFVDAGAEWGSAHLRDLDVLVALTQEADAGAACQRLRAMPPGLNVVVVLRDGTIESTRMLLRAGAADVIPYPASEHALALSVDRALVNTRVAPAEPANRGQVVAFLKAGGGVGATSLCVLTAMRLAATRYGRVALVDLDLQSGSVAAQLGLSDIVTVSDILSTGAGVEDTPFDRALHEHPSGVRVLANPKETLPLDAVSPMQIDALLNGLRRDFSVTLIDLPMIWNGWTQRLLHKVDRIVMVTQISVPRIALARRQLLALAEQGLSQKALTLVCNAVPADQGDKLPLKWAEKSLGKTFDAVVPHDPRTVDAFINEGAAPSARGPTAKYYSATQKLVDQLAMALPSETEGKGLKARTT